MTGWKTNGYSTVTGPEGRNCVRQERIVFMMQAATSADPSEFCAVATSVSPPVSRMVKRIEIFPLRFGFRLRAFS